MATFGHLFDDLPSLLILRPKAGVIIKNVDKDTEDLVFNALESRGYVLGYTKLGKKFRCNFSKNKKVVKNLNFGQKAMFFLKKQKLEIYFKLAESKKF